MVYESVAGHPMLTAAVQALPQAKIEGHQRLAELLLALTPPPVTNEEDVANMKLAIVLQMNFQVDAGADPLILTSIGSVHSKQTKGFRDRWIDPRAQQIVAQVLGTTETSADRYETFVSHRLGRN